MVLQEVGLQLVKSNIGKFMHTHYPIPFIYWLFDSHRPCEYRINIPILATKKEILNGLKKGDNSICKRGKKENGGG